MSECVLVTGGAGFIGRHLISRLAQNGYRLVIVDNLHSQVHGPNAAHPVLPPGAKFVKADIQDKILIKSVVSEVKPDHVIHLAAETGTGQSWDEVHRYCEVNVSGTAALVEAVRCLPKTSLRPRRFVLASSRAVYGEGAYKDAKGHLIVPSPRKPEDMRNGRFDPMIDGIALRAVPTPEYITTAPASIYASTKLMQELIVTQALTGSEIEPVNLRFQNVYGPGQSLKNPYTGVLSIFSNQILKNNYINIYEDGKITRDFVYVEDVVKAIVLALEACVSISGAINIGSGKGTTILDVAQALINIIGNKNTDIDISGQFRSGDIRHAVADVSVAQATLGWTPGISLDEGLFKLAKWVSQTQS